MISSSRFVSGVFVSVWTARARDGTPILDGEGHGIIDRHCEASRVRNGKRPLPQPLERERVGMLVQLIYAGRAAGWLVVPTLEPSV